MSRRDPVDFPPVDGEELAVRELAARASRPRRTILVPLIVAGLAGAVVAYLLVSELQFTILHAQFPWLSGVVGGIPPFTAALRIAQKLGNAAVGKRAPAWVDEQIRLHDLPPRALDEYLTVLRAPWVEPSFRSDGAKLRSFLESNEPDARPRQPAARLGRSATMTAVSDLASRVDALRAKTAASSPCETRYAACSCADANA